MRIGAGTARGRTLRGPRDAERIRPTADRVRQTIFNVLGQWFEGQRALDLYAGTGAFGLEAISRGALHATLVDRDREALELCRANAEALGFTAQVEVLAAPVERAVAELGARGARFELVFADPPYAATAVETVLTQLGAQRLLAKEGTVVVEHDRREEAPAALAGFTRVDERRFGDTVASFYRATAA